jgi:peptide/nickel transport system substrate-binding protein
VKSRKTQTLFVAVALLGAGCTDDRGGGRGLERGGTLRLAALGDPLGAGDPAVEINRAGWELYRCCLLRTLLSYTGTPTDRGGTRLHPDLAEAPPRVSSDGLTWVFHLRRGLRYAPPLQDTPIVAADVIRALERQAQATASYASVYSVIEGFADFVAGREASIDGLVARDPRTLVVRLREPAGDLGYRLSLPAAAPVPGAAVRGHTGTYASFLVASGPYMLAGSPRLDFKDPPEDQDPVRGYRPGRGIILVRNPSWQPTSDDLRPAYPDRIHVRVGGDPERIAEAVDEGRLDLQLDGSPPLSQVRRYQSDSRLADRVHVGTGDVVRFVPLNLAVPPFDDIHVRRAVNLIADKAALRRQAGGPLVGSVAGHVMVDGVTGGRASGFDPYATSRDRGDLERAIQEMRRSPYDRDRDGTCDISACRGVTALTSNLPPFPGQAASIRDSLAELGIRLSVQPVDPGALHQRLQDPGSKVALAVGPIWAKLYPDGAAFAEPLFGREGIGPGSCCNYSLVGATPSQLDGYGYRVGRVPSVEARIRECAAIVGEARASCWTGVDRLLSTAIVPWIPYLFERNVDVVSARIRSYSFDQFAAMAAVDRLALEPEA